MYHPMHDNYYLSMDRLQLVVVKRHNNIIIIYRKIMLQKGMTYDSIAIL